jgi:rhodanese-related sulfurtransferase
MFVIVDHMFDIVSPERAVALIAQGVVVVDVREPAEWEHGHIPGARLMSLATVRTAKLPKKGGVLFVCGRGIRSQTAARLAVERGVPRVYSLAGGTSNWASAGHPITTELSVAV